MNHQQKLDWVKNLQPGDEVGVYEFYGRTHRQNRKVVRKTPTGRVVLDCGSTYNKEGEILNSYTGRSIGPVPQADLPDTDSISNGPTLVSSIHDPVKTTSAFKDDGDMKLFSGGGDSVDNDVGGGLPLFGDD